MTPPPTDRAIWLRANVSHVDGAFHDVAPFEGYAEMKDGEWIGRDRLALRESTDDVVHHVAWMELKEAA